METTYPPVRPFRVLLIFAAIAAASAGTRIVLATALRFQISAEQTLLEPAFVWLLFGALAVPVVAVARRFPLAGSGLAGAIPAHLAAFVGISMTHTLLYRPFAHLVLFPERAMDPLVPSLLSSLRTDIFIYGGIVGAYYLRAHALTSFARGRLAEALGSRAAELQASLSAAVTARPTGDYLARIPLKNDGRVEFIDAADVERIEADGDYVRLHAGGSAQLLRQSLNAFEAQLDPRRFARVHRSAIVNVGRIRELQPMFHGEFVALMASGARVKVSRTYRGALMKALGIST